MTTLRDAYEGGIDAVLADNTLDRGGFADAMRLVITDGLSNGDTTAWIDALATYFNSLGIINNPTYNNLRNEIINSGKDVSLALFDNLYEKIRDLPESQQPVERALLQSYREDRDNADAAITRMDQLIAAEVGGGLVGRLVRQELRNAKQRLRDVKAEAREGIGRYTGDPDS